MHRVVDYAEGYICSYFRSSDDESTSTDDSSSSEEGKFLPWVMRIAHNLIIDHFRKNNRIPKFDNSGDFDIFTTISDSDLNIENKLIKSQIETHLKEIIEKLF